MRPKAVGGAAAKLSAAPGSGIWGWVTYPAAGLSPPAAFPTPAGKIPVETGQDPVGLTRTDPTAHPSAPPNLLYAAALPKTWIFLIYFGN